MSYGLKTAYEQGWNGIWEISASVGFIIKKFVTMNGHSNVQQHNNKHTALKQSSALFVVWTTWLRIGPHH